MKIELSAEDVLDIEAGLEVRISNLFQVSRLLRRDDMDYLNGELIRLQRLKHKISDARRAAEENE